MRKWYLVVAVAALTFGLSGTGWALSYNANVTNNAIFGSGNGNGFWTVDSNGTVELGLRAKIPFSGVYNSGNDGTYSYPLGVAPQGRWNVEWSINTNVDGNGGNLNQYTYVLGFDSDPTQGTSYTGFWAFLDDPVNDPIAANGFLDHSFGNNSTAQSAGVEAGDAATYAGYVSSYNLVQQSWRMDYYDAIPGFDVNPNVDGTYTYFLAAYDLSGNLVGRTEINVIIGAGGAPVPEPATMTVLGLGLGGLALSRLRKRLG